MAPTVRIRSAGRFGVPQGQHRLPPGRPRAVPGGRNDRPSGVGQMRPWRIA